MESEISTNKKKIVIVSVIIAFIAVIGVVFTILWKKGNDGPDFEGFESVNEQFKEAVKNGVHKTYTQEQIQELLAKYPSEN